VRAAVLLCLPVAALVACGSSSTSSGGAAAPPSQSSSTATSSSSSDTATSSSAAAVTVGSGSAGSVGTVLVSAQGRTLYRFTPESNGSVACTGACAGTWPPLTVPAGAQPQAQGSLSGKLATVQRPDGSMQVTYNGWPLYMYSGDSAAGTASGQGFGGKWFAVTPDQAAAGM
jgi:predicted lipoprotein with Yx(FWY)xxD motif